MWRPALVPDLSKESTASQDGDKEGEQKLFAIKTLNNSQLTSPSKFHRVTLVTTVSHVGSEITRGTRSKSESTAVAIFKFFGSEIVLSKVKAHMRH